MQVLQFKDGSVTLPTEGEWVMSTEQGWYVIVLDNDTGYLTQFDRLGLHIEVTPEGGQCRVSVRKISTVDGIFPGVELDPSDETHFLCGAFEDRITKALEQWAEETDEATREAIWAL